MGKPFNTYLVDVLEVDSNNLVTKVMRRDDNKVFSEGDIVEIDTGDNKMICTIDYFLVGGQSLRSPGYGIAVLRYYEWRTEPVHLLTLYMAKQLLDIIRTPVAFKNEVIPWYKKVFNFIKHLF